MVPPSLEPVIRLSKKEFTASSLGSLCEEIVGEGGELGELLRLKTPSVVMEGRGEVLRRTMSTLVSGNEENEPMAKPNGEPLGSLSSVLGNGRNHFHRGLLNGHISCSKHSIVIIKPRLGFCRYNLPGGVTLRLFGPFIVSGLIGRNFTRGVGDTGSVMRGMGPRM